MLCYAMLFEFYTKFESGVIEHGRAQLLAGILNRRLNKQDK